MRRPPPPALPLLLLALAGCGAQPTPAMLGAERLEASRGGHDYVLFRKGNRVEVIRLGHARSGEHAAIRETMHALIPEVTGCRPVEASLRGDSGELRGRIACPGPP